MKKAKIFKNGQSEAVRLPKEFRFAAEEVYVHRLGKAIILLPLESPWSSLVTSLDEFSDDFLETRNQEAVQKRKAF